MKKFLSWLVIFTLAMCLLLGTTTAFATENITVTVDGDIVDFDVPPQLIGGRTMVPLRAIFEALGATVTWDESTETVTAYNEMHIVKCTINNNTIYVDNETKTIDVAPMMINDRTLVPARFIAEALGCYVHWNPDTLTVAIVSSPIDYSEVEKADNTQKTDQTSQSKPKNPETPVQKANGTLSNPYSASDGISIKLQEWSFEPVRNVSVTCTNVISGSQANSLANSENRYNNKPSSNQEWIFMEFNVKFISSENGANDSLRGSDIIYKDKFFTSAGASIPVYDMATLGDKYRGKGVFDVQLYPGASSKIVIGLLTDKGMDSILLKIPYKENSSDTWINCTTGTASNNIYSYEDSSNQYLNNSYTSSTYYLGTTLPQYTSVTGEPILRTSPSETATTYVYNYNKDDFTNYVVSLLTTYGWNEYKSEVKNGSLQYFMVKGNEMVMVSYEAKYGEVWVITLK